MKENITKYNDMVDRVFLEFFQRRWLHSLSEEHFLGFPIKRFDITKIHKGLCTDTELSEKSKERIYSILCDLKQLMYFTETSNFLFYLGPAKIVGNGKYEEVNLNTMSILQEDHYKVYLIISIYERILDLLEIHTKNKTTDPKRNKWGKKFESIVDGSEDLPIKNAEHEKMLQFREKVRRAEIHGLSSVFRFLKKDKWDHFQEETNLLKEILLRIAVKYNG